MNINENDINFLSEYLQGKGNEFNIIFDVVNKEENLPIGSTAKHIETSASECNFEVVHRGETSIRLRKNLIKFTIA